MRCKIQLKNEKQNTMIKPESLFKEEYRSMKNKIKKSLNPKPLKQTGRDNIKLNENEFDNDLAKLINP